MVRNPSEREDRRSGPPSGMSALSPSHHRDTRRGTHLVRLRPRRRRPRARL